MVTVTCNFEFNTKITKQKRKNQLNSNSILTSQSLKSSLHLFQFSLNLVLFFFQFSLWFWQLQRGFGSSRDPCKSWPNIQSQFGQNFVDLFLNVFFKLILLKILLVYWQGLYALHCSMRTQSSYSINWMTKLEFWWCYFWSAIRLRLFAIRCKW